MVTLAVVVVGVIMGAVALTRLGHSNQSPAARRAAPDATVSLAPLTAAVPGFSRIPQWGVAVAAYTQHAVGDDGTILTRTPAGQVARLDPDTGAVTWATDPRQPYSASWAGPWLTRIDGRPAAALTSVTALIYWPLPDPSSAGQTTFAATPRSVPLPAGSHLIWTGSSPLVDTGSSYALVRNGVLRPVLLPAGYQGRAATDLLVLAVNMTTLTWIRQAGSDSGTVFALPVPPGSAGHLLRTEFIGTDYLLAIWDGGGGQIVILLDTRTGGVLPQATLPIQQVDLTHAPVIRLGQTTVVGSVIVHQSDGRLQSINPADTITALAPGHAYAITTAGVREDIQLQENNTTTMSIPADAPIPFAGYARNGHTTVLVLVSVGNTRVLAPLPSTHVIRALGQ